MIFKFSFIIRSYLFLNVYFLGKNECPDDWSTFEDHCYQFNLAESQRKSWMNAKHACESVGDFSSLVSIHSKGEQDFLAKEISSVAQSTVWIGLNDRQSENVFIWSDNSKVDYRNWLHISRGNRGWKDCTVVMGMRTDGAWTAEHCSLLRRYICKRKRGLLLPCCTLRLGVLEIEEGEGIVFIQL